MCIRNNDFNSQLRRAAVVTVLILVSSSLGQGQTLTLTPCQSGWIDVDMESPGVITCTGAADSSDDIVWTVALSALSYSQNIQCYSAGSCSNNGYFNASRGAGSTSSSLTLIGNVKADRATFGDFTVMCKTQKTDVTTTVTDTSPTCQIDVVHPAEVTSCSAQFNTAASSGWTVSGSCDVSKVYSQNDRYSCQWTETKSGTNTPISSSDTTLTKTAVPEGGVDYQSLVCGFSKAFPTDPATYSYSVVVSPGDVQPTVTFSGSSTVLLPSATTDCPTDYVKAGDRVDCTCSSNGGNPPGSAVWQGRQSSSLNLDNVGSGDHDRQFRCDSMWGDIVASSSTFTLQVAYGPQSASIDKSSLPFDTDGTRDINFTCSAATFRPGVTYQWMWDGSVVSNINSLTLYNVGQADDLKQFSCTASNSKFGDLQASDSVTLDLHYPPTDSPTIQPSGNEVIVYQGDLLTLTCTVRGGKPVSRTTVDFHCSNKGDSTDSQSSTEVSSSVTYTSVQVGDGKDCVCTAQWKTYDWYTGRAQVTANVYYAPSTPSINVGSQDYPFMAGESPNLYCNYPGNTDPGNPIATLTMEGQSGQGQVSVAFTQLSSDDNGRKVVCEARNTFTDEKTSPVVQEFQLEVYYLPVITLTSLSSDDCSLSSSNVCVLEENQRVRVNCTVQSNPSIDTVAWQPGGGGILDLQADRNTSMDYKCDAKTIDKAGDNRLPLTSSQQLTVLVKYQAEVAHFSVNEVSVTVVNETDRVHFSCLANGRPTAQMVLSRDGEAVMTVGQGSVSRDDVAWLNKTQTGVGCQDAGQYTCDVSNGVGQANNMTTKLYVNCGPRLQSLDSIETVDRVNFLSENLTLYYPLTTYPAPHVNYLTFTGLYDNSSREEVRPAPAELYVITCPKVSNAAMSSTNCSLLLINARSTDKGFYNISFGNDFGKVTFRFYLDINGTVLGDNDESTEFPIAAAVGGGIAAALVVIAAVAIAVFIIKRRRHKGPKESKGVSSRNQQGRRFDNGDEPEMITNSIYNSNGQARDSEMITNSIYNTAGQAGDGEDETEIVNSLYSSCGPTEGNNGVPQGSAYEQVDIPNKSSSSQSPAADTSNSGGDVYAVVKKTPSTKASGSNSAADDSGDVYSTVDKSKAAPAAPSKPAAKPKPGAKPKAEEKPKPAAKPGKPGKAGKADKAGKVDKGKKKTKGDKEPLKTNADSAGGGVYSNTGALTMDPAPAKDNVYENHAFEDEDPPARPPRAEQPVRTPNQDGLLYSTIAFTEDQVQKAQSAVPEQERTEYVSIDFSKQAPAESE